jgi:nucleoside-diphosphate-sugar epimerase
MAKILMTGSGGTVGTILKSGLQHDITDFDLPESSILDFPQLLHTMSGHDTVIHLAWATKHDNWLTERFDANNLQGTFNVLEAAQQSGVKRVIIASSVHADDFVNHGNDEMLDPYALPTPDSPYGSAKCMIEALGRYFASSKNLEVICIRLGGVNRENTPPDHPKSERQVWLSQRDCVSLVNSCVEATSVPNKYAICYGISNNSELIHDLKNPFDWRPVDSAK